MNVSGFYGGNYYTTINQEPIVSFTNQSLGSICLVPPISVKTAMSDETGSIALRQLSVHEIVRILQQAGGIFASDNLSYGDTNQSPDDYCQYYAMATGNPIQIARNMLDRTYSFLSNIETYLEQDSPSNVIDTYDTNVFETQRSLSMRWLPMANNLGVVLSDSLPYLNFFWLLALAMKYAIVLRPGWNDPMTPFRLILSLLKAGIPASALNLLMCGYDGIDSMADRQSEKVIMFGGQRLVDKYCKAKNVKLFGPGHSKIYLDVNDYTVDDDLINFIFETVVVNAGKGCVNTSMVLVNRNGYDLAERLAYKLMEVQPLDPRDPASKLSALKSNELLAGIQLEIDKLLTQGAMNVTANLGCKDFIAKLGPVSILMPIVLFVSGYQECFDVELPFPFVVVAEVNRDDAIRYFKGSLALTLLTEDNHLIAHALSNPTIRKLFVGMHSPAVVDFSEPHEGLLGTYLYTEESLRW